MARIVLEPDTDTVESLVNALTWKLAEQSDPLGRLRFLSGLAEAVDRDLGVYARQAAVESTWQEIGDALGTSRQAAHKRFSKV